MWYTTKETARANGHALQSGHARDDDDDNLGTLAEFGFKMNTRIRVNKQVA